ncbi:MAG: transporter [Dehalococcoidales bacterium]|nr:transporter [Dehalococcoidales bacterium]
MLNSVKSHLSRTVHQWGGGLAVFFGYTHLSHDLTAGLLVALLPFIRQDMGLNYLQSGLLVSAFSLTSGFSQLLGGLLADRISRRKAIALGLGGVGACAIIIGLSSSYYALLASLIIMGIVTGAYHPSAVPAITDYLETARRGRAIALHMLGGNIGFVLGPLLGGAIASILNWHLAYILLSIPALVAAPLVLTRLKFPAQAGGTASTSAQRAAAGSGRKLTGLSLVFRTVASAVIPAVIMGLIVNPTMSFVPLYLVDKHHFSSSTAALWVSIIRSGGLVGSLFGGWLADKWGRRRAIFLALGATGPVLLLIAWLPLSVVLVIAFVLFGLVMAMREATTQTYLMDSTPSHLRATVFGIYFGFGMEGSSLIQPVAGHFMDIYGIGDVFIAIALIGITLSVVTVLIARKT